MKQRPLRKSTIYYTLLTQIILWIKLMNEPEPEHVTSCPWPCFSRSTTTISTIGPRLLKLCMTVVKLPEESASVFNLISCESPMRDPTNTTPLSRYVMHSGIVTSPKHKTIQADDHVIGSKHRWYSSNIRGSQSGARTRLGVSSWSSTYRDIRH